MDEPSISPDPTRVLTEDELDLASGGARFNPQPDPPGIVPHNPPTYVTGIVSHNPPAY